MISIKWQTALWQTYFMAAELGISDQVSDAQREKHLANHAGYLQSWIKALPKDPFAIFTAAKDCRQGQRIRAGLGAKGCGDQRAC